MSPSDVERPAFFVAAASPRLRSRVVAASRSPFASVSAPLHSIIPAPVASRSFFTIAAVISIVVILVVSSCQSPVTSYQFGAADWPLGTGNWQLVPYITNAGRVSAGVKLTRGVLRPTPASRRVHAAPDG